jgi:hypothetical protein
MDAIEEEHVTFNPIGQRDFHLLSNLTFNGNTQASITTWSSL